LIQRRIDTLRNSTWPRDLAGAWIFYTVLPLFPWLKPRFERIARFAPLIGIFIGLIQGSLWLLLSQLGWPNEALALLVIGVGIWITGGLHLDGLIDTADGLAAGNDRCLEAMKDSRVGASGVQALTIVLLIQIAALIKLNTLAPLAILIASFWGRCAPLWAIEKFPYIKENEATSFHQLHWKSWKELKPSVIALIIILFILKVSAISWERAFPLNICILIGILPAFIIPELLGRKLGGHCGDSYGASLVLTETFILMILSLVL